MTAENIFDFDGDLILTSIELNLSKAEALAWERPHREAFFEALNVLMVLRAGPATLHYSLSPAPGREPCPECAAAGGDGRARFCKHGDLRT